MKPLLEKLSEDLRESQRNPLEELTEMEPIPWSTLLHADGDAQRTTKITEVNRETADEN